MGRRRVPSRGSGGTSALPLPARPPLAADTGMLVVCVAQGRFGWRAVGARHPMRARCPGRSSWVLMDAHPDPAGVPRGTPRGRARPSARLRMEARAPPLSTWTTLGLGAGRRPRFHVEHPFAARHHVPGGTPPWTGRPRSTWNTRVRTGRECAGRAARHPRRRGPARPFPAESAGKFPRRCSSPSPRTHPGAPTAPRRAARSHPAQSSRR